jgi:hypothetical protein
MKKLFVCALFVLVPFTSNAKENCLQSKEANQLKQLKQREAYCDCVLKNEKIYKEAPFTAKNARKNAIEGCKLMFDENDF